jgi:hypothetical protein
MLHVFFSGGQAENSNPAVVIKNTFPVNCRLILLSTNAKIFPQKRVLRREIPRLNLF